MFAHSLENFPCTVSSDGETWHCGMPGCCYSKPKAKKSLIVYHKQTHFPKYKCEECGELFPQKSRLDTHVRTAHTGEKPYACPHCERAFPQQSNLNDHVKKHHPTAAPRPKLNFKGEYVDFYNTRRASLREQHPDWTNAQIVALIGEEWKEEKVRRSALAAAPPQPLSSKEDHSTTVPRENPGAKLTRIPVRKLSNLTADQTWVDLMKEIDVILSGDV